MAILYIASGDQDIKDATMGALIQIAQTGDFDTRTIVKKLADAESSAWKDYPNALDLVVLDMTLICAQDEAADRLGQNARQFLKLGAPVFVLYDEDKPTSVKRMRDVTAVACGSYVIERAMLVQDVGIFLVTGAVADSWIERTRRLRDQLRAAGKLIELDTRRSSTKPRAANGLSGELLQFPRV